MSSSKLRWYNVALLAFSVVWGFSNVVNNFANQGLTVIFSWIVIMLLYFIPYTLMVGQLGSVFQNSGAGVSSWINNLLGSKWAYLAAWTYWVVHVPYLAQKPQIIMISLSWLFRGNGSFIHHTQPLVVQTLSLILFLSFVLLATRGLNAIKKLGNLAGILLLIMSMLFIILGISAPFIAHTRIATPDMGNMHNYIPKFSFQYLTTLSMLIFAVGGCEKISPYVNKTRNASREFPKAMIALAIIVAFSAIFGSIGMGIVIDAHHIPNDLMSNGAFEAFQILGHYYHVGNLFMWIFAVTNTLGSATALAVSIDAPLRMLLDEADERFIPKALLKKNKQGVFINGYKMVTVLVSILIIVPALGIKGMSNLYNWLLNLNSICMPMRYLWVFLAYIMLVKSIEDYHSDYVFVKNKFIGLCFGIWTFGFTAFACLMGMVPKSNMATFGTGSWWFQITLNIVTPIFLIALGLVLPTIARKTNRLSE